MTSIAPRNVPTDAPRHDPDAGRPDTTGRWAVQRGGTRPDIPLARPPITDAVRSMVLETLESGWLTEGPVTRAFERRYADFIGVDDAIAVTSATTGFEVVLRSLDLEPGDEIIVPDFTYPSTASIPALLGLVPVLVDVDLPGFVTSAERIEAAIGPRTRAIMPVSLFGNPLDYGAMRELCDRRNLVFLEDAACAVGAEWNGIRAGAHTDASIFSLHPRKILTTGEGGMITTSDPALAERMRTFKNFGMRQRDGAYWFDIMGTNLKTSDILSSVGLAMMNDLDALLASRRRVAAGYHERLADWDAVTLGGTTPHGLHAYQTFPLLIEHRDEVIRRMRERRIETQFGTHALHRHPAFTDEGVCRHAGTFPNAQTAWDHCLVLPLADGMTDADIDRVVAELRAVVDELAAERP
jgi:dTDP-4-amino-4,6-dideoxygalactose transaminase